MTNVAEVERIFRKMIRQEMSLILMGQIVSNETASRSTIIRQSNESPRKNIRSVQPFGISSRAPVGTPAFIVPTGFDHTNQNLVGHFDETNKPETADGEVALYNAYGQLVYLSNGKIQIGSKASSENMVLGKVLKAALVKLISAEIAHTHTGNLGYPTSTPVNASDFQDVLASPVQDDAMLSNISFTEKG